MSGCGNDMEKLQHLSKELSGLNSDGNKTTLQSKLDNLSGIFNTFKDTTKEK